MTDESSDQNADRDVNLNSDVRDSIDVILSEDAPSHRLGQLHRAALEVTDQPTETAVYEYVTDCASELFDAQYAMVAMSRGDQWVTVTSTQPDTDGQFGQHPLVSPEIETAMDRNGTVLVENVEETVDDPVPFENGHALCSPVGDESMLQLLREEAFDDIDVQYAELLGWIAASRLEQLALSNRVESMEEQLTTFTDFQAEVFERATHDLRGPLTTIVGYMELLSEEAAGTLSDDQRNFTRLVLRKATELDAAIETLTSSFDTRLANARAGRSSLPDADLSAGSAILDGPFVVLSLDAEMEVSLTDQLKQLGYEVTIAADPQDARNAVRQSPSSTIVVELFVRGVGVGERDEDSDTTGVENGVTLAETIRREDGTEETTVRVMSTLREDAVDDGQIQLGASAYIPEEQGAIVETVETLLGIGDDDRLEVLVFDSTATDEPIEELPVSWTVSSVDTLEAARTTLETDTYDLGIVRTDGLSDREGEGVRTLRARRHGKRLPVVLVDRESERDDVRHVLGGKLFIQRPISIADLTTMLVSATEDESDDSAGESD